MRLDPTRLREAVIRMPEGLPDDPREIRAMVSDVMGSHRDYRFGFADDELLAGWQEWRLSRDGIITIRAERFPAALRHEVVVTPGRYDTGVLCFVAAGPLDGIDGSLSAAGVRRRGGDSLQSWERELAVADGRIETVVVTRAVIPVVVDDGAKLVALLADGLGEHRELGFGMVWLTQRRAFG